jgi:hypothetical protein
MRFRPGSKWHNGALACLAVAALLTLNSSTQADPDLWGHIRFGQDMLTNHKIVQPDTYSYLSGDQLWINHEWLAEAVFALIFNTSGAMGLIILKLLAAMTLACFIYFHLHKCGLASLRIWIIILLVSIMLHIGMGSIRPHLFTYVCFTALLFIIQQTKREHYKGLWLLVPIFALWANLHGGFLAGVGILALWLIVFTIEYFWQSIPSPRPIQFWTIMTAAFAALLATLLTPYGLKLWSFLLKTATVARPEISEWVPISLISITGGLYLLLMFLGFAALIFSRKGRTPFEILAFVLCALLPLLATRHLPLFALAMPFLTGEHIADLCSRRLHLQKDFSIDNNGPRIIRSAFILAFLFGSLLLLAAAWNRSLYISVDNRAYPINAVKILKTIHAKGAMAVDFDWGEYVIWHLGPMVQVSVDGRRETVYSPNRYQQCLNFIFGINDWKAVLRNKDVTMALVKNKSAICNLMNEQKDWILGYSDKVSALFLKRSSNLDEGIKIFASQKNSSETYVFP